MCGVTNSDPVDKFQIYIGGSQGERIDLEYGSRNLHHGWIRLQPNGEGRGDLISEVGSERLGFCYGAFIENGRIIDESPNGYLKKMVRYLVDNYNRDLYYSKPGSFIWEYFWIRNKIFAVYERS